MALEEGKNENLIANVSPRALRRCCLSITMFRLEIYLRDAPKRRHVLGILGTAVTPAHSRALLASSQVKERRKKEGERTDVIGESDRVYSLTRKWLADAYTRGFIAVIWNRLCFAVIFSASRAHRTATAGRGGQIFVE